MIEYTIWFVLSMSVINPLSRMIAFWCQSDSSRFSFQPLSRGKVYQAMHVEKFPIIALRNKLVNIQYVNGVGPLSWWPG